MIMNKNILKILLGQCVTVFGSQIYTFAISFYILRVTGSGLFYGISLALGMLPQFLCSPIAGAFCDLYSRKKIIVFTDAISGLLLLFIFFISGVTGMNLYYIYFLMFFLAVLGVFNSIALQSAIPNAVKNEELPKLNSLNQSVSSFARIIAPWIGGIVILWIDIRLFIFINSISFLMASLLEYYIQFLDDDLSKMKSNEFNFVQFFKDLKESYLYSKSNSIIFIIMTFMVLMNFLFQFAFSVPVPYIINNVLKLPSQQYGIIQGATSLGAFITSIIMSNKFKIDKVKSLLIKAIITMSILLIIMGIVTISGSIFINLRITFILFAVLNFLFGGCIVASNIPLNLILQIYSEDYIRGRIMGISNMLSSAITPCAVVISGVLLDSNWIQPYVLCVAGGFILLILVLNMAAKKEMQI